MALHQQLRYQVGRFWPLIKSLQTALLLVTGLAGYLSASHRLLSWIEFGGLALSLTLAISGSTVLNMLYDRDIDARMDRTCKRPLSTGLVSPAEALGLGLGLSVSGLVIAALLSPLYALVVFAGLFFDVIVYTIWLKRRTPWAIIWGGISGGMPVLAGRVLAAGSLDGIGLLLATAVLLWIPTHILTFSMRYFDDYNRAGIPTFPKRYGFEFTRKTIALSSVLAGAAICAAAVWIGITAGALSLLALLSAVLLFMSLTTWFRPSEQANYSLFKYASFYMLGSMLLLALGAI